MLGDFRKGLRTYRDDLRNAIATDDYTTAKRCVHTLKGMCLQFGANEAGAMAAELEANTSSIADIARRAEPLIAILDGLDAALAARDVTTTA
jgi:HPt (histidine-containing phosphotransfer) domain-containing protein